MNSPRAHALASSRDRAGLSQCDLAARLNRPHSFVGRSPRPLRVAPGVKMERRSPVVSEFVYCLLSDPSPVPDVAVYPQ